MPELPDILVYLDALESRVIEKTIEKVQVVSPFLVRTFDPPIKLIEGKKVIGLERMGKRIVLALEDNLFLVMHLMVAGRLHWKKKDVHLSPKAKDQAALVFPDGALTLTEAGTKKRASFHLVREREALEQLDPAGLEVMDADVETFREALSRKNHTLKRALTDPRILSGIGNAYSDEILHRAQMSPFAMSAKLSDEEYTRLLEAIQSGLTEWTDLLREQTGAKFPEKVTAFRPEMAVHGKYNQPCPVCGTHVQRIRYASTETNYCPRCQTDGKIYADRSLSRLLKDDWPKSIEELEEKWG